MKTVLNVVARCLSMAWVAVSFLTGCQSVTTLRMYNGPDLPGDQLATVVVPWCISLRTVDGSSAPSTLANEMRLMLKPGIHTLEARYVVFYPINPSTSEKITSDYIPLTFAAEAGKTYFLCSENPRSLDETRRYADHVSLWIEEHVPGHVKGIVMKPPVQPAPMPVNASAKMDLQAQLQEIWEKASEQDRKAFMEKVRQEHH